MRRQIAKPRQPKSKLLVGCIQSISFISLLLPLLASAQGGYYGSDQQRRDKEAWKRVEDNYNSTIQSIRNRPSSIQTYSGSSSSSNYSPYAEDFARRQKAMADHEDRVQRYRQEQQDLLQKQYAEIDRRVAENKRRQEEHNALELKMKEWQKANANNPLATLEPPPVFKNVKEKYSWYCQHGMREGDFYYKDGRAALVAAQMAMDGEGTDTGRPDTSVALNMVMLAPECNMRWCIISEILETGYQSKVGVNLPNCVKGYKKGTRYTDTAGANRSYKNLYRLYTTGKIPVKEDDLDEGMWMIDTYLQAFKMGIPGAGNYLSTEMGKRQTQLPEYPGFLLQKMAGLFNLSNTASANPGLELWGYAGNALEAEGTGGYAEALTKVFDTKKGRADLRNFMLAKLHVLNINGNLPPGTLTPLQAATCAAAWPTYSHHLDVALIKDEPIRSIDALTLFNYYNSTNPKQASTARAFLYAKELAKNGDLKHLQMAALAYRLGKAGWPKNDARALELYKVVAENTPETTPAEKMKKAMLMNEIAEMWQENKKLELTPDPKTYLYFLGKAANLHPFYTYNYAQAFIPLPKPDYKQAITWLKVSIDYNQKLLEEQDQPKDNIPRIQRQISNAKEFISLYEPLAKYQTW